MSKEENNSPFESNLPTDAELEALLDEESDEEFGSAQADESVRAVLKDWSAQDFANIYTRFRPHLERHARRFLRNQSQVDEVVQDAFLYLMVTLPELDSELGVLRFLKWKVRLLCLDVIRLSGRAQLSDIDAHPEFESGAPEVSAALEQAEDAAIVRLALSKLNPRHREVLVAAMYEEKTSAQIAAQVGLSENATNQLIFRARSAFKKALLGDDVDITGMSTAKILSVAARKAALEAKKIGAQAMVFALFLILAIGAFINTSGRQSVQNEAGAGQATPESPASPSSESAAAPAPATPVAPVVKSVQNGARAVKALPVAQPSPSANPFSADALRILYTTNPEVAFVSKAAVNQTVDVRQAYMVAASQGAFAEFTFDADAEKPFEDVKFVLNIDDKQYTVYASKAETVSAMDKDGQKHFVFYSSMKYFVDATGKVWDRSDIAKDTMRLELVIDNQKRSLVSSVLTILPAE
jgi:RNA polymerase sigma-70 factor (ECF subfamily)